jgi:hypothetical protein
MLGGSLAEAELRQRALRMLCDARDARGGHLYLVQPQPEGVQHVSSHALPPPNAELTAQVQAFVAGEPERSQPITATATGTLTGETSRMSTIMTVGIARFEIVPLSHLLDGADVLVGVAALAVSPNAKRPKHEPQLLAAIASYLLARRTKD